jgi:SAM-dependent methyltransferase
VASQVRWTRTPGHDHHFAYNWPAFLELLPPSGRATLDLGCGEGRCGAALRARGHRVTGVDASTSLAELARATGAYEEVLVADAVALPFGDAAFDLVLAFMSLQDMDDAANAVSEVARVLAPGGRFAAAIVHPFASGAQRAYFDTQRTVDAIERDGIAFTFHQMHRPLEGWLAMLTGAGFVIEELREPRPGTGDDPRPLFPHVRCALAPTA